MASRSLLALLPALALLAVQCSAFYLPGVAPQDLEKGEEISLKVNKLMSAKNLPYQYYSLPYCRPEKIVPSAENLGELLRGDRILNSPYTSKFRVDQKCTVLCRIEKLDAKQVEIFKSRIADEYRVNMILDNLPIGMPHTRDDRGRHVKMYQRGFPVGWADKGAKQSFLFNHLSFTVLYHEDATRTTARIVGFEVAPLSIKHELGAGGWQGAKTELKTCSRTAEVAVPETVRVQPVEEGAEVIFTYDVLYTPSDIPWASRWDTYLVSLDEQIHWFSIVNSTMIVLFLTVMVAMIMARTLRRDISYYNAVEDVEGEEETGWKLVHGDVFRAPAHASLLAVAVGTGAQLLGMAAATVVFALAGFLSPANRGGLTTSMLLLYVVLGLLAGYASARVYKRYGGEHRRSTTLRVALCFPGFVSAVFLVLDFLVWGQRSSGAVPPSTLAALIFLWFGISVPLCFVGAHLGYRGAVPDNPVRTNKIPRQIPPQPAYLHPLLTALVGGVLPFGAVFIELFFILSSVWQNQFYYLFGFLALVAVILCLTCAEISVVLCYFQLCFEDYRWAWRSFFTSGASALYLLAYSAAYFVTKLEITKLVPTLMYFAYMGIVSLGFSLMMGTIGFYACSLFVRRIYAAVKID